MVNGYHVSVFYWTCPALSLLVIYDYYWLGWLLENTYGIKCAYVLMCVYEVSINKWLTKNDYLKKCMNTLQ